MNERILMVEDEPGAVLTVGDRLRSEGYRLDVAEDGPEGERLALEGDYDLILLDLMLPGKDGISICRDLRGAAVETPIIMVTARGEVPDKVLGLKIGADDYLTKPFDPMELTARIEAVLRRRNPTAPSNHPGAVGAADGDLVFGPFVLSQKEKELYREGETVALSSKEYKLLLHFLDHRGEILSRDELLDSVWGYDAIPSTRTVDVHVAWLRQKLGDKERSSRYIKTVMKRGYKFIG